MFSMQAGGDNRVVESHDNKEDCDPTGSDRSGIYFLPFITSRCTNTTQDTPQKNTSAPLLLQAGHASLSSFLPPPLAGRGATAAVASMAGWKGAALLHTLPQQLLVGLPLSSFMTARGKNRGKGEVSVD